MGQHARFRRDAAAAILIAVAATAGNAANDPTTAPAGPPGVVIHRSSDFHRVYLGSPSLAVLPDGTYVASHDYFGPGTAHNRTAVFASGDRGRTWKKLTEVDGQFWSALFVHGGAPYLMGSDGRNGSVIIRRSADGGTTWTVPKDARSGLLLKGAYHTGPMPVVVHRGRIWRAMEFCDVSKPWPERFQAMVLSADAGADLLDAGNWTASNRLAFDPAWATGGYPDWVKAETRWAGWMRPGWLEGNVVVGPRGGLVNVLRVHGRGLGKAAIIRVRAGGRRITFDPAADFIDFPGGGSKFTIRRDAKTRRYWSIANKRQEPDAVRNVLVLTSSADLRTWRVECTVLQHSDSGHHAWQYVTWHFDGDDMIFVSRTAWDGSRNFHDANYLTFHRLRNFRDAASRKLD